MELKSIFVDRRNILRSGWRFTIFLVGFVVLAVALGGIVRSILTAANIPAGQGSILFLTVNSATSLFAALLVGWLCGKLLEGVSFRALGAWFTKLWANHLVLGVLIGSATIGFAVLIAVTFGGLRFTPNPDHGSTAILLTLGGSFTVFAVAAAFEEALFRGYILQTFSRSDLGWLAVIHTSSFFGLVHAGNPSAGIISMLNTILAGFWFGVAYLKTRDLWFVWGMHLMWNWVQVAVFGIEVSGLTEITTAPLLKEIDKGPTWLTGETYGIEGGIACTIAIVISTAVIYFLPVLRPSEEMFALTSKRSEPPA